MKFATGLIVLLSALACTSPVDQARPKEVGSNQSQRADALPDDNNAPSSIAEIQALFSVEDYNPDFQDWYFRGGDYARYIFLNTSEFWLTSPLSPAGEVRLLPVANNQDVANLTVKTPAGETTIADYVADSNVDGAIVVHNGKIIFEDYPRMSAGDLHIWFSVSKTFVSTSVAILEDRGLIDANAPIETYLTDLQGTAWEGISVIDILDMASGIDCPERHQESDNCFWSFYAGLGWPQTESTKANPWDAYESMGRGREPGEAFEYTSINTELLNRLITAVSGQRFADFVESNIWQRMGARLVGQIISTWNGNAFSAQPQRKASSSIYKHKGANFRREPATRNDAVDVGVVLQGLAPGMEHGDKRDPGSSRDQATRTLFTGPPGDLATASFFLASGDIVGNDLAT